MARKLHWAELFGQSEKSGENNFRTSLLMMILLILSAVVSAAACAALLRMGQENARRYRLDTPQRFHVGHVPRLGGVAMFCAISIGWLWMVASQSYLGVANRIPFDATLALAWWLIVFTCMSAGLVEDITHRLPARWRFIGTIAAAVFATLYFGLAVTRVGAAPVDALLQGAPWLGIGLAVVAVTGLPHAFNLIDGYNGLAGLVALICALALAYVALQVGDRQLAGIMIVLAGATAGFLVWNYPHGLIFAGDGGAYLWGITIAPTCILLVQRHAEVSPWFPVLLLIYPIWETLFSIYRKLARGQSPSLADALHFHQLIYRRVVRGVFHHDESRMMLIRNNRTSPYLWGFTIFTVVPAVLFWKSTGFLVAFTILFIVTYMWSYHSIVRFRAQRWLRRRWRS